ncbi:UBP-type zinc finger domain-containing protein [Deinococcus apachensis]|uniref:UBP-type zinc finger domain-containing protein n=1 Tax=Deinococcus apachensis TaxID=309886 RepID=UPI000A05C55C|nr:UBP-type zinc finger domain-containing protein [Deinococcus apachensis]
MTGDPVVALSEGCEDCRRLSDPWVELRVCLTCGYVGCCDSSKNRHATAHFHAEGHPVMRSFEPGERWAWCYVDQRYVDPGVEVEGAPA